MYLEFGCRTRIRIGYQAMPLDSLSSGGLRQLWPGVWWLAESTNSLVVQAQQINYTPVACWPGYLISLGGSILEKFRYALGPSKKKRHINILCSDCDSINGLQKPQIINKPVPRDPRWWYGIPPQKTTSSVSNYKSSKILESHTISKFDQNYREKTKKIMTSNRYTIKI